MIYPKAGVCPVDFDGPAVGAEPAMPVIVPAEELTGFEVVTVPVVEVGACVVVVELEAAKH
jgi:hypothetical protein